VTIIEFNQRVHSVGDQYSDAIGREYLLKQFCSLLGDRAQDNRQPALAEPEVQIP
jgi:hypothetical protein